MKRYFYVMPSTCLVRHKCMTPGKSDAVAIFNKACLARNIKKNSNLVFCL